MFYRITIWILLVCFTSIGQEYPPIINYTPSAYKADNQNWMLSQGSDGEIYSANNKGLLTFNGAQWNLYPSPNESIVRSVKTAGSRVYTGAYMDFGYWERMDTGILVYTSLTTELNEAMVEDEQIWNIISTGDRIVFQSFHRFYIYNPSNSKLRSISFENTIYKSFLVDQELFFQEAGKGLFTFKNGAILPYDTSDVSKEEVIIGLFKIDGNLIVLTQTSGFYKVGSEGMVPWNVLVNDIFKETTVYSTIHLKNGNIAVGTVGQGLYIVNKQGDVQYVYNQSNGLGDNTVLSLFEDTDNNIWVGLDYGVDCLNNQGVFKEYLDRDGLLGTTYAAVIQGGYTYLGTNQGLFYKGLDDDSFTLISGTEGQVWFLDTVNDTLFCGHNNGTFTIDKETATLISAIEGAWNIKKIPGRDNVLLQGNFSGLYVLEREDGQWKLRNKIEGFDTSAKLFEFVDENNVLVAHEYKGVFEVSLDEQLRKATSTSLNTSVDKGAHSSLATFDGQVIYASGEGIFSYNTSTKNFIKNERLSKIYKDAYISGKLVVDNTNALWLFTQFHLVQITKDNLENEYRISKVQINQTLRNTVVGYESIISLGEDDYLLGTSNGYLHFNLASVRERPKEVQINKVRVSTKDNHARRLSLGNVNSLNSQENNISINYCVAAFDKYQVVQYQYKLEGLYNSWSEWSTSATTNFENLPHGPYTFYVRAKVGDTITQNESTYTFEIRRPWFLSNLALLVYVLLICSVFLGLNTFYKSYYKK